MLSIAVLSQAPTSIFSLKGKIMAKIMADIGRADESEVPNEPPAIVRWTVYTLFVLFIIGLSVVVVFLVQQYPRAMELLICSTVLIGVLIVFSVFTSMCFIGYRYEPHISRTRVLFAVSIPALLYGAIGITMIYLKYRQMHFWFCERRLYRPLFFGKNPQKC